MTAQICSCTSKFGVMKRPYPNRALALQGAAKLELTAKLLADVPISVYPCPTSEAWHVGTTRPRRHRRWNEIRTVKEFGSRIDRYLDGEERVTPWREQAIPSGGVWTAQSVMKLRRAGLLVADFGLGFRNHGNQNAGRSWLGGLADKTTTRRLITAANRMGHYVAAHGPDIDAGPGGAPEVRADITSGAVFGAVAAGTDWFAEANPEHISPLIRAELADLNSITVIGMKWGDESLFIQLASALHGDHDHLISSLGVLPSNVKAADA